MEIIKFVSALINSLIFIIVAGFHYYWVFGGKYGMNAVLPEIESSGKKAFVPSKIATAVVATLFLSVGLFFILTVFQTHLLPINITTYTLYAIAGVTFIRAIGDFKYVGFFKKKSNTLFAINDTRYYSPLCIAISGLTLVILKIWG